jgi:polysaccharide pyruvyl transferase WcaK-like protein
LRKDIRIGITGPISETNFGDYAMFVNNLYDFNIKNVTVFSYNKGFSEAILKDYCVAYDIKVVEVKMYLVKEKHYKKPKAKVGFQPFNPPTDTPLDILYRIANFDEVQAHIRDIDVLIVNGGGYFNHLWNNSLWRSNMLKKIIAPMLIATQEKKRVFFMGNSFGPFDSSEEFFNYVFNYIRDVIYAVRDRIYSSGYLSRLGIEKSSISFVPDDLFFINNDILSLPLNEMIDIHSIGKYIVLEVYYPLEEIKEYIEQLKAFSENIRSKYGLSIVFLPFDFERGGMWQGEYLSTVLSNFYLCSLNSVGYLPIQDAYHIIKNAELVLCTRYHAMVLAVGAGVPVINTTKKVCDDHRYYFNKNYGLLEYAFERLQFNEMDFIRIDFPSTLKHIEENFSDILSVQKELYSSEQYKENKECLKKIRLDHLSRIAAK